MHLVLDVHLKPLGVLVGVCGARLRCPTVHPLDRFTRCSQLAGPCVRECLGSSGRRYAECSVMNSVKLVARHTHKKLDLTYTCSHARALTQLSSRELSMSVIELIAVLSSTEGGTSGNACSGHPGISRPGRLLRRLTLQRIAVDAVPPTSTPSTAPFLPTCVELRSARKCVESIEHSSRNACWGRCTNSTGCAADLV